MDWLIGASLKNKAVTEERTIKRQRCGNKGSRRTDGLFTRLTRHPLPLLLWAEVIATFKRTGKKTKENKE